MENKKFIVAIVILSILLLAALGFIGYDKFLKKDDETKKPVLLAGTEFRIYDMDAKSYVEQVTTYPDSYRKD